MLLCVWVTVMGSVEKFGVIQNSRQGMKAAAFNGRLPFMLTWGMHIPQDANNFRKFRIVCLFLDLLSMEMLELQIDKMNIININILA